MSAPRPTAAEAVDELRLRHEARRAYPELRYADLTRDRLAEIAGERGVDFATALFHERLRTSDEHGAFIREIDAVELDFDSLPRLRGTVWIAPAAGYREFPELGGDGALVRAVAGALGLDTRVFPSRSWGSVTENAAIIRETLAAEPPAPAVVVSMSKGGAEVRRALDGGVGDERVSAWVNICGLVRGSPLIGRLLDGPWWRRAPLQLYLARYGARLGSLRDLRPGGDRSTGHARAPEGVRVVNVVACPLSTHLHGPLRRRHAELAPLGPNDGSTLLSDAILCPGAVYPIWGADHYFRTPAAAPLLYGLFLRLAEEGHLLRTA